LIEALLFYILAVLAVVSAISVISQRSPMSSVISLVVCFFALAVLYLLLNAHFVAVLQVIVYAGAIMVLFLFVIMMLNLRGPEAPHSFHGLHKLAAVALVLCLVCLVTFGLAHRVVLGQPGEATEEVMAQAGNTEMLAELLFQRYLLPFEAVSILLLVAIVGAIVMASRRFERPDHEDDLEALQARRGTQR
jgi:NADH-quinone oxidoreductase subunit J